MSRVAVIVTVYNAYPFVRQCIEGLLKHSSPDVHVFLVDNHSPCEETREFVSYLSGAESDKFKLKAPHRSLAKWFTVLDPGRNLGAHNGWNYGFEHGVLGKGYDYVVKLDDDTVITTSDWDRLMVRGLEARPDIAFLSADGTLANKQLDVWDVQTVVPPEPSRPVVDNLIYEIPPRNIVDFHCVMFRAAEMLKWERNRCPCPGDIYGGRVWLTNPEGDGDKRLYGGEELYMAKKVRAEGRKIAYFRNVFCNHLGNDGRCPDYQLWKVCYGYCRWTDKAVDEWLASGEMLRDLRKLVSLWAMPGQNPALAKGVEQYVVEAVQRIGEIGGEKDAGVLLLLVRGDKVKLPSYTPRTDMPTVTAALEGAAAKLQAKFGPVRDLAKETV